jgi:hypothetical protein
MNKIWKISNPTKSGEYICRMANGYIKMCFWTGAFWLDMWKDTLDGTVVKWMGIPEDQSQSLSEIAWDLYCKEAGLCGGALDHWDDLSDDIKIKYLYKVAGINFGDLLNVV